MASTTVPPERKHAVKAHNLIINLLQLLSDDIKDRGGDAVGRASTDTLRKSTETPCSRLQLAKAGGIGFLVDVIRNSSCHKLLHGATSALKDMACEPSLQLDMANTATAPLLALLGQSTTHSTVLVQAIGVLQTLTRNSVDSAMALLDADGISTLLQLLSGNTSNEDIICGTLTVLSNLAAFSITRAGLKPEEELVTTLVKLLQHKSQHVVEAAANALQDLASNNIAIQGSSATARAIQQLLQLAEAGTTTQTTLQHTIGALSNLVVTHPGNQATFTSAGGIGVLAWLLYAQQKDAKCTDIPGNTIHLLHNLLVDDKGNSIQAVAEQFLAAGGMSALLPVLSSQDVLQHTQAAAVDILHRLITFRAANPAAGSTAIPVLVQLIRGSINSSNKVAQTQQVLSVLSFLVRDSVDRACAVVTAGGVQVIVSLLSDSHNTTETVSKAVSLLEIVVQARGVRVRAEGVGVLAVLQQVLSEHNDPSITFPAAAVIAFLSGIPQNKTAAGDTIGVLLGLLKSTSSSSSDKVKRAAAVALWELCKDHEANGYRISLAGGASILVNTLANATSNTNGRLLWAATGILAQLASYRTSQAAVVKALDSPDSREVDLPWLLATLMNAGDLVCRRLVDVVLDLFTNLLAAPQGIEAIMRCEGAAAAVWLLRTFKANKALVIQVVNLLLTMAKACPAFLAALAEAGGELVFDVVLYTDDSGKAKAQDFPATVTSSIAELLQLLETHRHAKYADKASPHKSAYDGPLACTLTPTAATATPGKAPGSSAAGVTVSTAPVASATKVANKQSSPQLQLDDGASCKATSDLIATPLHGAFAIGDDMTMPQPQAPAATHATNSGTGPGVVNTACPTDHASALAPTQPTATPVAIQVVHMAASLDQWFRPGNAKTGSGTQATSSSAAAGSLHAVPAKRTAAINSPAGTSGARLAPVVPAFGATVASGADQATTANAAVVEAIPSSTAAEGCSATIANATTQHQPAAGARRRKVKSKRKSTPSPPWQQLASAQGSQPSAGLTVTDTAAKNVSHPATGSTAAAALANSTGDAAAGLADAPEADQGIAPVHAVDDECIGGNLDYNSGQNRFAPSASTQADTDPADVPASSSSLAPSVQLSRLSNGSSSSGASSSTSAAAASGTGSQGQSSNNDTTGRPNNEARQPAAAAAVAVAAAPAMHAAAPQANSIAAQGHTVGLWTVDHMQQAVINLVPAGPVQDQLLAVIAAKYASHNQQQQQMLTWFRSELQSLLQRVLERQSPDEEAVVLGLLDLHEAVLQELTGDAASQASRPLHSGASATPGPAVIGSASSDLGSTGYTADPIVAAAPQAMQHNAAPPTAVSSSRSAAVAPPAGEDEAPASKLTPPLAQEATAAAATTADSSTAWQRKKKCRAKAQVQAATCMGADEAAASGDKADAFAGGNGVAAAAANTVAAVDQAKAEAASTAAAGAAATSSADDDEKDSVCCIVCMDAPRSVLLLPCKHLVLCDECAKDFKPADHARTSSSRSIVSCPVCRVPVAEQMQVYMA